jgi:hypothetical protein
MMSDYRESTTAYYESALATTSEPEACFDPTELLQSLRRTHDAVQLSYVNRSQPEWLLAQRDLFWRIIGSTLSSPHERYNPHHIQAFAEIVDYLWYRDIDSPRSSDALLVFGIDRGLDEATKEGEAYLLLNEDVVSDKHLGDIREVLGKYGFDTLMSIREQNYGSQQGLWQEALHDQVALTPSARWIREVCAGAKTDTRLTSAEYMLREAAMQSCIIEKVRQGSGQVGPNMYFAPGSSRMLRRIPFDLEDEQGSRKIEAQAARTHTAQLESFRRAVINLLVRGHDGVKSVSQDGEQIVLYGSTGTIAAYSMSRAVTKLRTELGTTNNNALNCNGIDHLIVLVDALFAGSQLNGQPYDAIVGGATNITQRIIERGFRLESFSTMVDALNQLKMPTPYVGSENSQHKPPEISLSKPLYTPRPDCAEELIPVVDLRDEIDIHFKQSERPPLLEIVMQSYNGLLREARDLLLLDTTMPDEQVFAALKASHLRQDNLLVTAIGTLYSARVELSGGVKELSLEMMQELRAIQARLDVLSSFPPIDGPPDETSRLAIAVQTALHPLKSLYAS